MRTLSIIIPCYNESRTITELLNRVDAVSLSGWQKEVVVVDDASKDGTRDLLRAFESKFKVLYQEKNGGKGSAVRRGLSEATGDFILIQDADLEYHPSDIPALLAAVDEKQAQVVYGSRNLGTTRHGGKIARLGVWIITVLINTLYGLSLTDVWTCYKLFPKEAKGDFIAGRYESELLFTAALARRRLRFVEVPISYSPRSVAEGKKIRYRDGFYAIYCILKDWAVHLFHA